MSAAFPYLILTAAMALWGSSFVALKYAFEHFDPWLVIWARLTLAGVVGLALLAFLPQRWPRREDLGRLTFMALCEPCFYFLFETLALRHTSAAQAGTITATLPILVAVGAWLILGEVLTRRLIFGGILALLGAVGLSLGGTTSASAPLPLLGNALELLAMVCAAGYVISVKKLTTSYSPWFLVVFQNCFGCFFFLPLVTMRSEGSIASLGDHAGAAGAVIYLGLAVSLLAFFCYTTALKRLTASRASLFTYLIPVFAVVCARLVLGEVLAPTQYLAAALVLAGVALGQERRR